MTQRPTGTQQSNDSQHFLANRCPDLYFRNHFCSQFCPFKQYFSQHNPVQIIKGVPKYRQTLSVNYRNNLGTERQLQYLRRTINHDYSDSATRELLEESSYEPYNKIGGISVIINRQIYWGQGTKLKEMKVQEVLKIEKEQISGAISQSGKVIFDFRQIVLQIKTFRNQLFIRSSRILFIFDYQKGNVLQRLGFGAEILAFWFHKSSKQQKLFVSLYNGISSWIEQLDMQTHQNVKLFDSIETQVHSGWSITRSQSILCLQDKVYLWDKRAKMKNKLMDLDSKKERIFSGSALNFGHSNRCFVLSKSYTVEIFDIRKCSTASRVIPHYCEESPPTILEEVSGVDLLTETQKKQTQLFFDPNPRQTSILVAYSPYPLGSSLFAELNSFNQSAFQVQELKKKSRTTSFQLLFDRGKLDHSYHPRSIASLWVNNKLAFFHLNNFQGLDLQVFQQRVSSNKSTKTTKKHFQFRRVNIAKPIPLEQLPDANQEWFQRRTLEKYLKKPEDHYWENLINEDDQKDLQLAEKKAQERYLRFADLKNFYQQLFLQAQNSKVEKKIEQQTIQLRQSLVQDAKENKVTFASLDSTLGATLHEEDPILGQEYLTMNQLMELNLGWDKE